MNAFGRYLMQKKLMGTVAGLCMTIAACLLIFAGQYMFGQETRASLGGRVTDPQGNAVQHAMVVMTADATKVVQTVKTNETGDWRIQFLLPGFYHFEVSAPGFESSKYAGIELQVNDMKTMDTQLHIGSQTESVTVEATTPLIDTTSAISGTVITTKEMEEVSAPSNDPTTLAGLTPGVTGSAGVGGAGVYLWGNQGVSEMVVNGSGSATSGAATTYSVSNFTLDGGYDTNNNGEIAFEPPMDAVSELRVITDAYDAAIGRQSAGTFGLMTKTGGSQFHGDLYEFNLNKFLNANTYQNDATGVGLATVHTNEYGGSFGGPVYIPKLSSKDFLNYDGRKKGTFLFFDYAGERSTVPVNPGTMSVPTAAERNGDFSSSYTVSAGVKYPINIYDPNTIVPTTPGNFARTEFGSGCKGTYPQPSTCNVIPQNRINPISKAIMAMIPLPENAGDGSSTDSNNYVKNEAQQDKVESYMLRVDQAWNNANHSFVSMQQNHWSELSNDPFGPANILNAQLQARINKRMTIDHTVVLSPKYLLDLNYTVSRWTSTESDVSSGVNPTYLGFSPTYVSQMQLASIPLLEDVVTGAEEGGLGNDNSGEDNSDTNQDFKASMTQTHKNHIFRYGAEYLIQQRGAEALGQLGGEFTFGNNWTLPTPVGTTPTGSGSDDADFLLGFPTSGSIPTNATAFWSQHFQAYYFQDDYRVSRRLTLNLGLRWDYERPLTERFDRYVSRFDPNYVLTGVTAGAQANYATLLGGSSASNTGLALLQAQRPNVSSFVAKGGLLYAGVNGTSRYVENPRYKYFQPRFGFAYEIHPGTVVRGGFGRFVQADFNTGAQTGYSTSTALTTTTNSYESAPTVSFANPYPNGTNPITGNSQGELTNVGSQGSYTDPNIGRLYVDAASASLQQQIKTILFEVGFTLNKGHGQSMAWEVNDPTTAEWHAAYDPQFTSTGAPVLTSAASTTVNNPFYQVAGIETSLSDYTSKTIGAYSLLRPNPLLGNLTENRGTGQTTYYAMNTRVERRFKDGFSILNSFSWSKMEAANSFIGPQTLRPVIYRQLSTSDQRFHEVLSPVYELPFGRGKLVGKHVGRGVNELIGGWEFTGEYQFQSGNPISLPTNSSFFQGGSPSLGSKKTAGKWFNTSMFEPYPSSSTTVAQIAAYPSWTGVAAMPGYGWVPTPGVSGYSKINNGVYNDFSTYVTYNQSVFGNIREPYMTNFTLGARKRFAITDKVNFQLGMDAFNVFNHPQFGAVGTSVTSSYFGVLCGTSVCSQVNNPRNIQLRGRLTF
jgi:hypothetical protein